MIDIPEQNTILMSSALVERNKGLGIEIDLEDKNDGINKN